MMFDWIITNTNPNSDDAITRKSWLFNQL